MSNKTEKWESCVVDTMTVASESGGSFRVDNVPGERNLNTGEVFVDPSVVLKVHYANMTTELGLTSTRDLSILSLLGSPVGRGNGITAEFVQYKYNLNKMLFYQWMGLQKQGLGDIIHSDRFVAERKGPVPSHIDEDLARLETEGKIIIERPKGEKHGPWVIRLTPAGKDLSAKVLRGLETTVRELTSKVKSEILPLSPERLKARVHTDYPQYRRKYVEVDDS